MQPKAVEKIELICPRCRYSGDEGIVQSVLELGRILKHEDEFVLEGFIVCPNANCQAKYPVVEGVPIVLKDIKSWWNSEKSKFYSVRVISTKLKKYFETLDTDMPSYLNSRNLRSTYIDLHYGSLKTTLSNSAPWANYSRFWMTMIDLARPDDNEKFERSLDLGCSVGRFTFELASFSELAVGIDLNFNMVSEAARIHRTQTVAYARRKHGRWYEEVQIDYRPPQNVLFLVADCLDPPFRADSFDLVAGLNLIDNVKLPLVLIGQMDALLRQSGYLITGAPYEWRSEICEPQEWLESDELDSPEMVRGIIEGKLFPQMGLNYEVVHEILDVPWILRHHDRYWSLFLLHLLKARKMS